MSSIIDEDRQLISRTHPLGLVLCPAQNCFPGVTGTAVVTNDKSGAFGLVKEHGYFLTENRSYLKVIAVLSCTPDEFNDGTLYYDEYTDEYRVRESDEPPMPRQRAQARKPSSKTSPSVAQRVLSWLKPW